MTTNFRVLSWNCRRASTHSPAWDYLLELDPDVAILQDYGTVPQRVLDVFLHARHPASVARDSRKQMSGILLKGIVTSEIPMTSSQPWVARELEERAEFFTGKAVTLRTGVALNVVSVYCLIESIDSSRLEGIDTSGVRLELQRSVWPADLMVAAVRALGVGLGDAVIVAGDLNTSETFDLRAANPRGNRELLDRMAALHMYDALRAWQGRITPTFRHARGGMDHQIDHLFVSPMMLSRLVRCETGDPARVFVPRPMLSDHLPIIADFAWPE